MTGAKTLLVAAMLGVTALSAQAEDWVDIKDPAELRALYSNKTFRGNGWVGHYRADGTGLFIVQNSPPVRRTWEVKGTDQVCVTPEVGLVQCFTFKRVSADRTKLMVTNVKTQASTFFTVEDGVPKF